MIELYQFGNHFSRESRNRFTFTHNCAPVLEPLCVGGEFHKFFSIT